ncbi:MAG: hypothetical protein ACHQJ6_01995 [Candidatus Berkiellales bacterium]
MKPFEKKQKYVFSNETTREYQPTDSNLHEVTQDAFDHFVRMNVAPDAPVGADLFHTLGVYKQKLLNKKLLKQTLKLIGNKN